MKAHFPHFAELERGEMLIGKWWWEACLDRDLRSTADQSLAIYCLRGDSLIDLNDLACKLLPAAALDECVYWRRGLVGCGLICIVFCLLSTLSWATRAKYDVVISLCQVWLVNTPHVLWLMSIKDQLTLGTFSHLLLLVFSHVSIFYVYIIGLFKFILNIYFVLFALDIRYLLLWFLPAPQHNRDEWNCICNSHSIDKLSTRNCVVPEKQSTDLTVSSFLNHFFSKKQVQWKLLKLRPEDYPQ